jgi:hypothetical protein
VLINKIDERLKLISDEMGSTIKFYKSKHHEEEKSRELNYEKFLCLKTGNYLVTHSKEI